MERLTMRDENGDVRYRLAALKPFDHPHKLGMEKLFAYEDAEERGELVRVVRCDGCVYHVDNGYHYCKKLRIDCPLSDFYCAYGKAALMEA